jgi:hypothetical protein
MLLFVTRNAAVSHLEQRERGECEREERIMHTLNQRKKEKKKRERGRERARERRIRIKCNLLEFAQNAGFVHSDFEDKIEP